MLLTFPTKESLLRKIAESRSTEAFLIISNFKSLADWNLIPLRALTILLGPNSAGKSAIYDAIKILRQLITTVDHNARDQISLIKRGGRSQDQIPTIGFSCPYSLEDVGLKLRMFAEAAGFVVGRDIWTDIVEGRFPYLSDLLNDVNLPQRLQSKRYTLLVDDLDPDGSQLNVSSYIDDDKLGTWNGESTFQEVAIRGDLLRSMIQNFVDVEDVGYSDIYKFHLGASDDLMPHFEQFPSYLYMSGGDSLDPFGGASVDEIAGQLMTAFHIPIMIFLWELDGDATDDVRNLNSSWSFVSIQRGHFDSGYISENFAQEDLQPLVPRSNSALEIIKNEIFHAMGSTKYPYEYNSDLLPTINKWLSEKAFFGSEYKLTVDIKVCVPIDRINSKRSIKFDLTKYSTKSKIEFLGRVYLTDEHQRKLTFSDVGTGFSQVIPVLIDLALDETTVYKQPEVHLHPKLQSKVADCFVEAINTARQDDGQRVRLIETHSEHFVLRVLRRLKDSFRDELLHTSLTVYPEDFALIYFKPTGDHTEIYQIRVSENGEFIDSWPDGFFDERDDDIWGPLQ